MNTKNVEYVGIYIYYGVYLKQLSYLYFPITKLALTEEMPQIIQSSLNKEKEK